MEANDNYISLAILSIALMTIFGIGSWLIEELLIITFICSALANIFFLASLWKN